MDSSLDPDPRSVSEALSLLGHVWGSAAPSTVVSEATARDAGALSPPVIGRYRVLRTLGAGSYGVVFAADDPATGRAIALKVAHPRAVFDADARARFEDEAKLAGQLEHPGIVRVYDVGFEGGFQYIASELCEGPDLAAWLRTQAEPVAARAAAALALRIAQAMTAAHERGIVHRDLKPGNILLVHPPASNDSVEQNRLSGNWHPKVADFGLAKLLEGGADRTRTGAAAGTPQYMAPEQASGTAPVGASADVWAIGAILYEVLTGLSPFRRETVGATLRAVAESEPVAVRRLRPDLPRDLETIVSKCLSKHPAQRYPSARDLADELDRFLKGYAIHARPVGPWRKGWNWCRRNRGVAALGTALALTLTIATGVATGLAVLWRGEARRATQNADAADLFRIESATRAFDALVEQARVRRLAGGSGQRIASLAAIRDALEIGLVSELPDREQRIQRARHEYYSARLLPDLMPDRDLPCPEPDATGSASLDRGFDRYAYGTASGEVVVRRAVDGEIVARISASGDTASIAHPVLAPDGRSVAVLYEGQPGQPNPDGWPVILWTIEPAVRSIVRDRAFQRSAIAFSPEGKRLALGQPNGVLRVYDCADGSVRETYRLPLETGRLRNRFQAVHAIEFHPDFPVLAVASTGSDTVHLFERTTGARLASLPHPVDPVQAIASIGSCRSPPGFAVFQVGGRCTVWDPFGLVKLDRYAHHLKGASSGCVAPTGDRSATFGSDGTVAIRESPGGNLEIQIPIGTMPAMQFRNDGRGIGAERIDRAFRTYRLHHADAYRRYLFNGLSDDSRLVIDPGGKYLAYGERGLQLVDLHTGRALSQWPLPGLRYGMRFDSEGRLLVSTGGIVTDERRLYCVAIGDGGTFREPAEFHRLPDRKGSNNRIEWNDDGSRFVDLRDDALELFDRSSPRRPLLTLSTVPVKPIVAFDARSEAIALTSESVGGIVVYRIPEGTIEFKLWTAQPAEVAFSPDGRWIVVHDGHPRIFDRRTGQPAAALPPAARPRTVRPAFSPDSLTLALPDGRKGIRFVDPQSGSLRYSLELPDEPHKLDWSLHERWLRVVTSDRRLALIDLEFLHREWSSHFSSNLD